MKYLIILSLIFMSCQTTTSPDVINVGPQKSGMSIAKDENGFIVYHIPESFLWIDIKSDHCTVWVYPDKIYLISGFVTIDRYVKPISVKGDSVEFYIHDDKIVSKNELTVRVEVRRN